MAVDAQLKELMGSCTVEELLKKDDAWVQIINISRNLWDKKMPDTIIKQFLNDYDEMRERQK